MTTSMRLTQSLACTISALIGSSVLAQESSPPRVVVYAKVDAAGAINSLRVVSGLDPETDNRILASVSKWDFHPAYRDGEAVEVEALFGIPLR